MRSILILAATLLICLTAPGCGGRSSLGSGGNSALDGGSGALDNKVAPPDTTCTRPKGGCNGPGDCEKGQACSTSMGECGKDPCCPQCAACYGHCVVQTFFAEETSASAGADLMPPISWEAAFTATVNLSNTSDKPQTGITFSGGLIGIPMGPMVYTLTDVKPTAPFSGTLPAKGKVTLKLTGKGKHAGGSIGAPCNKKTYVRVNVGFGPGNTLRADSPSFTFGCVH